MRQPRDKKFFSEENLKNLIISRIQKKFGTEHNIKLAMFKATSEYNDESYNYNPLLILIDDKFNELVHEVNVYDLCPSEDEQYNPDTDESVEVDDITIKF